jgi:hypothetical protein
VYIIAFGIEIAFFLFALALFASAYFAQKSAAPFFPTPKRAIERSLAEVKLKKGEIFYDLGAGTGKALLLADKNYGAITTGFEISIIFYCLGKLNLFFHNSKAKLFARNFFKQNLSDAGVVFCFLFPPTMQKMEDKLKAELRSGARVIVYAFPLPTMVPTKTITVQGNWKMFFYNID